MVCVALLAQTTSTVNTVAAHALFMISPHDALCGNHRVSSGFRGWRIPVETESAKQRRRKNISPDPLRRELKPLAMILGGWPSPLALDNADDSNGDFIW
jgi:hypothetical protein